MKLVNQQGHEINTEIRHKTHMFFFNALVLMLGLFVVSFVFTVQAQELSNSGFEGVGPAIQQAQETPDPSDDLCFITQLNTHHDAVFPCENLRIASVQDPNADSTLCYIRNQNLSRFYCDVVIGYCAYVSRLSEIDDAAVHCYDYNIESDKRNGFTIMPGFTNRKSCWYDWLTSCN